MIGARVGDWVLGAELGRGPVGVVYRAAGWDDPARTAAVKLLSHPSARGPEFARRFPAEMLALRRLGHPNVARFLDAGVHAGTPFYATELVAGPDLGAVLRGLPRTGDDPALVGRGDFLRVAVQIARGLRHGHHRSVLHRGLKPGNVLLGADGVVKLTDFGVGKILPLAPLEAAPDPWGVAGFLAPEHFTGKPLTRRTDLYALGAVLYAAAAGRPPFRAASPAEFLHKHAYTLPDRPARFAPGLAADLDELICELLAKDPARRPGSAAAVLDRLDQARGKLERKGVVVHWPPDPGDAPDPGPAPAAGGGRPADPPAPRPLMARPRVVLPLVVAVVLLTLVGVFWPRPTADALYAAAVPLLASEDPADWDRAWDSYLGPLADRHPDRYAAEVRAVRTRIADRRRLREAVQSAGRARSPSEAERWYGYGLRQLQAGDAAGARRTWDAVGRAFAGAGGEEHGVKLAADGLAELARTPPPPPAGAPEVAAALDRVRARRLAGDAAGAAATLDGLEALYRDDPAAAALIRSAR